MTIDWDMVQFKRKIIDNARYLFKNYIDTTKGLDALYSRSEVSSDSITAFKNYNLVKVTAGYPGEKVIAWKIDDASNINKLYVRAKVNVYSKSKCSLIITDSTLRNQILFTIEPTATNSDFSIVLKVNDSDSTVHKESVDLSSGQFYDIEGMIDFENNTISYARDNVGKTALSTDRLPSFDVIHLGLGGEALDQIPIMFAKDVFITWE